MILASPLHALFYCVRFMHMAIHNWSMYFFEMIDHFLSLKEMFNNLGEWLCTITGFDSFSLQPNAGAAGEYAGLMVIRAYHKVIGW